MKIKELADLIDIILPEVQKTLVIDDMVFVKTMVFHIDGLGDSYYLIFGGTVNGTQRLQRISYELGTGNIEMNVHMGNVKL